MDEGFGRRDGLGPIAGVPGSVVVAPMARFVGDGSIVTSKGRKLWGDDIALVEDVPEIVRLLVPQGFIASGGSGRAQGPQGLQGPQGIPGPGGESLEQARAVGDTFSGGDVFWDDDLGAVFGKASGEANQEYGRVYWDSTRPAWVQESTKDGTGTYRNIFWRTAGADVMKLDTNGVLTLGTPSATPSFANYFLNVRKDGNIQPAIGVENRTNGTSAGAGLTLFAADGAGGTLGLAFAAFAAGYTDVPAFAGSGVITNYTSANIFICTRFPGIPLRFGTNSIERARFLDTGEFLIGSTALVSDEILLAQKNTNGQAAIRVNNPNAGALAKAYFLARADTSEAVFGHTSSTFTPTDGINANEAVFAANVQSSSLSIVTTGADPIRIVTNAIERARFLGSGEFIYGATTLTAAEKFKIVGDTRIEGTLVVTGNTVSLLAAAGSFGGGVGVVFVGNASVVPAGSPVGGGLLYSDAGAGKWKGSGGTVTTFGPAEPHCAVCKSDYGHEWVNPKWGRLQFCMNCLADHVADSFRGNLPRWIKRDAA